jgi:hypothetical protein
LTEEGFLKAENVVSVIGIKELMFGRGFGKGGALHCEHIYHLIRPPSTPFFPWLMDFKEQIQFSFSMSRKIVVSATFTFAFAHVRGFRG